MDFMFEDEVDEVGSDVEAYCPKCKADTTHVVISKYEDEIRRVQCNPCGDVHSFRKPRGEVEDDVPEPIAAKKRAMLKKPTWEEFFAKHGEKQGKPYEFREQYNENAIVTHPKFGRGFVTEVMSDSKVEITFKDARRVLVHNRKDMPGLPLAAEGDGIPSKGAKAKAAKTKAAKEEKPVAVSPKDHAKEPGPARNHGPAKDHKDHQTKEQPKDNVKELAAADLARDHAKDQTKEPKEPIRLVPKSPAKAAPKTAVAKAPAAAPAAAPVAVDVSKRPVTPAKSEPKPAKLAAKSSKLAASSAKAAVRPAGKAGHARPATPKKAAGGGKKRR